MCCMQIYVVLRHPCDILIHDLYRGDLYRYHLVVLGVLFLFGSPGCGFWVGNIGGFRFASGAIPGSIYIVLSIVTFGCFSVAVCADPRGVSASLFDCVFGVGFRGWLVILLGLFGFVMIGMWMPRLPIRFVHFF